MKYYIAIGSPADIPAATALPPYQILASYYYFKAKKKQDALKECLRNQVDVFIDSGAFSAKTKGVEIIIDDYCKWLIDTGVSTYAGLDVIGDAEQTKKNCEYMKKEYNLSPIATFHLGSRIEYLEEMIDNYSYIALGGLVKSEGVKSHLYKCWNLILKRNPGLRVHGFGTTNIDLVKEYPWYSVDSSSYSYCRRFGDQPYAYNGLEITMMREEEFLDLLEKMGYKGVRDYSKEERGFLTDFHSIMSYKNYAAMLTELNKLRKFEHLTALQTLF